VQSSSRNEHSDILRTGPVALIAKGHNLSRIIRIFMVSLTIEGGGGV
jgi:hypothetical protein